MRLTVRDLVFVGIFGALWGVVETGVGSVLHAMRVPFAGALLGASGMTVALAGRLFVPRVGSVLYIGCVTALLKLLSVGGVVLNPMIGIMAEAGLAELVLTLGGVRRASFAAAGAAAVTWTLVHPFLTIGVLAGRGAYAVFQNSLAAGAALTGLPVTSVTPVVIVLVGVHVALGVASGLMAWSVGRLVQGRLGTTDSRPEEQTGGRNR